ncbi:hypothetical protein G6O67_006227 [Ophiocordyceps sinensis]|uniref:Peptide hydrolase n=1 Tax=Ophiocordyceps sinensis TaxID=72228 RepID=A0A8H4PMS8_9HYPO|nr:hypothetical protein G6O67_006227 [Ophiocordyceps sinensis]
MRVNGVVAALVGVSRHLARAVPDNATQADPTLRLIKTSESDPGQWIAKDQLFQLFTSKRIGFMDMTNLDQDEDKNSTLVARQGVSYPDRILHEEEANTFFRHLENRQPRKWLRTLTNFHTRHFESPSGREAADWLFDEASFVASANPDITVRRFEHEWDQPSIIVQIPGRHQTLVILSAHFDSTAGAADLRSPGADDNGSGTVVVLETLHILADMKFRPENTVEFHFYAAEEEGLRGSMDIFRHYASQGKRVMAMLNQDMAGRSPSVRASVVTDFVFPPLAEYMVVLASHYLGRPPTRTHCGYACSDHASALRYSFPAALVIEDRVEMASRERDTSDDTYDKVDWATIYRHTKLSIGFTVEASHLVD